MDLLNLFSPSCSIRRDERIDTATYFQLYGTVLLIIGEGQIAFFEGLTFLSIA